MRPGAIRRRPLQYVSGPGDERLGQTVAAELLAGEHVNGGDVELDRHLLDPLLRGVLGDQAASAPDLRQLVSRLDSLGM